MQLAELHTKKLELAQDDVSREQFKEVVVGKKNKHVHYHDNTMAWVGEKTAFLDKKEEIGSIADAELHLSLLNAYLTERKDLEAVRVPELQELGAICCDVLHVYACSQDGNQRRLID